MHTPAEAFSSFLETRLNSQQKAAVTQERGSLLVIAGAGSGKTRVITARIAYLILQQQVNADAIVALTFTNKAAQEMKERVAHFLDHKGTVPFIGTFHGYCLRLLKAHNHLLKKPFLSILDEDDQLKLISKILERHTLTKKITPKQLLFHISSKKNGLVDQAEHSNPLFEQLHAAYEQEKQVSHCYDFDDLLVETLALFKQNPTFKKNYQQLIQHILVDEYQDTNVVQHELLKQMGLTDKKKLAVHSICVVGDEDQSIYSWRGATVTNIMQFGTDFPQTSRITIEQNYRSVQPILQLSNHLIEHNKFRNPKKLWSDRPAQHRIRVLNCLSDYQEAETVAQFLMTAATKDAAASFAILYRAHYQSRSLEEALIKHSIAYKIFGGIQFYERKEIKDMLAYLRLIVNPFDRSSFYRVINCPTRGLGEKFEQLFDTAWRNEPFLPYTTVAQQLVERKIVTGIKKTALLNFIRIFEEHTHTSAPKLVISHVLKATNYYEHLKQQHTLEDAHARIDNLKELLHAMEHFETRGISTVQALLDEIALMQEKQSQQNPDSNPVLLMTLHAAKGLEFNTVIIAGLEEGLLPNSRSLLTQEALEEERRLLYVGITRAQERLLLSRARYRYTYGSMNEQMASRFLDELPAPLAPAYDCSYLTPPQLKTLFMEWLGVKRSASLPTPPPPAQLTSTSASTTSKIKKLAAVSHSKFGTGIVQSVEQRDNSTVAQVKFKTGTKKISIDFLTPI